MATTQDTLIHVNRSVSPTYPKSDLGLEILYPELEALGPAEYDLADVELWLHDDQKDVEHDSWVIGTKIYEHLRNTDSLKACLGCHDATEIQKKGRDVFQRVFGNKTLYFWKSVAKNRVQGYNVLALGVNGGELKLTWRWIDHDMHNWDPAARFVSE